ncbi:hypothetical protein, partial [uncultured Porphyromonas sp.]|uniref:hypothetical protein n=1 Tax=uncultured Porphyromonas sp. TaxID=159274 RepID=UPI00261D3AB2
FSFLFRKISGKSKNVSPADTGKQMQKKVMAAPSQLAKDIPLTEDEMLTLKALMHKLIDRDTDK